MAEIIVGRNHSRCSECKGGADPRETSHKTRLGYPIEIELHGPDGCGARFTHCVNNYVSPEWLEGARNPIPRRAGV